MSTADALLETIRQLVREEAAKIARDETLETLRALNIHLATDDETDLDNLVGAEEIAPIVGCDVSTPAKVKKAVQRVYYLARTQEIPSVRISARQLRFSPSAVRRRLAQKTTGQP